MIKFDLTTEEGMKKAMTDSCIAFPIPYLMFKMGKAILSRNAVSTQKQKEVVEALIEQGKRDGVDEMEITMGNYTGVKSRISTNDKYSVDILVGADDKMTLRVKYK